MPRRKRTVISCVPTGAIELWRNSSQCVGYCRIYRVMTKEVIGKVTHIDERLVRGPTVSYVKLDGKGADYDMMQAASILTEALLRVERMQAEHPYKEGDEI